MAKQEAISFMEFKNKFNSEDACPEHFFKMRWPDGFKCPKCGTETYYVISINSIKYKYLQALPINVFNLNSLLSYICTILLHALLFFSIIVL